MGQEPIDGPSLRRHPHRLVDLGDLLGQCVTRCIDGELVRLMIPSAEGNQVDVKLALQLAKDVVRPVGHTAVRRIGETL